MAEVCQHVGSRGKNKDIKCKNKANCGSYCKKHQKKIVEANLARDEVFGKPEAPAPEPQQEKVKYRFSVWKFTLNSQSDFSKMNAKEKIQFKNAMEFIFNEEQIYNYLEDRTNEADPKANAPECKIQYFFEVGELQHRLHVHGVVELRHTGNYRLHTEKIRAVVEKILGKKVHFNAIGSADTEHAWAQYMTKNQVAEIVEL